MLDEILEALKTLDHDNDDHWTDDGSPRVDVVKELIGKDCTRRDIINAAPKFVRGAKEPKPEPDDTFVLDMDPKVVMQDAKLLEKAIEALDQRAKETQAHINELDERLKNDWNFSALCTRMLMLHKRRMGNVDEVNANIQEHLKKQQVHRKEKADRMNAFYEKGLDLKTLQNYVDPRVPLDKAMQEKPKSPSAPKL